MKKISLTDEIKHMKIVVEIYRNSWWMGKEFRGTGEQQHEYDCAEATLGRLKKLHKSTTRLRRVMWRDVAANRKKV